MPTSPPEVTRALSVAPPEANNKAPLALIAESVTLPICPVMKSPARPTNVLSVPLC